MAVASRPLSGSIGSSGLRFLEGASTPQGHAPWFDPERLKDPDFSVDTYVADLRQYAPLEALIAELEKYLTTLKGKLVEVINEDYNDFVSLSTKLVNVDGAVLRMQKPLQEVAEKLLAVKASLQQELDSLGQGLALRQETAAARTLLELMQDTAHSMSKVEGLLGEVESSADVADGSSSEQLEKRCRMLERLAEEVSRLNYHAAKGKDLPFVQQLETPMRTAKEKLLQHLISALRAALNSGNSSARQLCLLAFAAVSDTSAAEQVVKEVVVRPCIGQILEGETGDNAPGAKAANLFPPVLHKVEELLNAPDSPMKPILEVTASLESSLQSFNFLGNSFLAEVEQSMMEALPAAISPGVPATFHRNYKAAMAFLEALEKHCSTPASVSALRNSPAYDSFLKRWKLSIYFSTRFQEIAGALETAINALEVQLDTQSKQGLSLQLSASQAFVACLQRAISEEVFLQPLTDKFCRLLLQCLARYCSWLRLGTSDVSAKASSEQQGEPRQWGSKTPLELLASALSDLYVVGPWLTAFQQDKLCPKIAFLPPQVSSALTAAFEASLDSIMQQQQPLSAALVTELADRCSAGLSQLRGITAMYRMSARPAPTRASHYVSGLFTPLRQFLELKNVAPLQKIAQNSTSEGVISEVADRFRRMSTELLDTLRKTESSLKRIRQNRAADSTSSSGPSDIEKISLQLFLDVQELGRQAGKFDVDAAALPAYQELWKCVASADQADSISL